MASASDSTRLPSSGGPVTQAIRAARAEHEPHLRLVTNNPPEPWERGPRHTVMTFDLSKHEIDGAYYGVKNLLWANARMMAALESARVGDTEDAEKNIQRAIVEMTSANAAAERLYNAVKHRARRANRREVRS